jgi:DHA1 family multidrug resistance protein-like MFS transporter
MSDILRDSIFGHGVRMLTGNKWLKYPEEKDPSIWERSISVKKSAQMAVAGRTGSDVQIPKPDSETSSRTEVTDHVPTEKPISGTPEDGPATESPVERDIPSEKDVDNMPSDVLANDLHAATNASTSGPPLEPLVNTVSRVKVDPERGRDLHVVDWYGDDDPEV